MRITTISTTHLRIPLSPRTRIPLGETARGPEAIELIAVHVATDGGVTGFGFTYTSGPGAAAIRSLIDSELSPLLVGEVSWVTGFHFDRAEVKFRAVGFAGLAARAYAALDIALWDIKAKAANVPLFQLLGNARPAAPFFVSDIAVPGRDSAEVLKLAKPLMKQGAMGLRVEVGHGDVQADADRVREISDGLGENGWVSVAAGGRYDLGTAQALSHFFEDIGVDLFEDPIPHADEPGYTRLAELQDVPLAVGSHFDTREQFFRVIRASHMRTVRPDPCRLGGITPLLRIAALADAFHTVVSPVRMTEVGVHLACGLGVVPSVDSVSWFKDVFTGGPTIENGKLVPSTKPGLGIELAPSAEASFRV